MMLGILLVIIQPLTCQTISSDRIYGRDLAKVLPALAAIAPEMPLGFAPLPGRQRTLHISELKRIALASHIDGALVLGDVCFAWDVAVPSQNEMRNAMEAALAQRKPSIEIVESSLMPVPKGEYVFPLAGLSTGSSDISIWRGHVQYAGKLEFPIWARVRVKVEEQRAVARVDLRAGETVGLDNLKVELYKGFLQREKFVLDPTRVEGMTLRRTLAAGTALAEDMLEAPREVHRGDTVNAIVQTGAARLEVQGVAEGEGRKGDVITIRNPRSGRSFHARVEGRGVVAVVPGGEFGLAVGANKS